MIKFGVLGGGDHIFAACGLGALCSLCVGFLVGIACPQAALEPKAISLLNGGQTNVKAGQRLVTKPQ